MTNGQYFVFPIVGLLAIMYVILLAKEIRRDRRQENVRFEPAPAFRLVQRPRFYDQDREGWWG
jgi:hypothetical protein